MAEHQAGRRNSSVIFHARGPADPPAVPASRADQGRLATFVVLVASDSLTSNLLMAGWLGLCLGLYALGDSLVALFGVTLIRDRSARLEDIRQLRRCRGTDSRAGGGPRHAKKAHVGACSPRGRPRRCGHLRRPRTVVVAVGVVSPHERTAGRRPRWGSRCLHSAPTVLGPTVYEFPNVRQGLMGWLPGLGSNQRPPD